MKKIFFILLFMVSCATLKMNTKVEVIDISDGEKYICENTIQNKSFQTHFRCIININGQKYICGIDMKKDIKSFDIEQDCIIQIENKESF